ncbi:PREDICTED: uncharacterized protein LOC105449907 isoform X2 [Wasmannia auropunctata]|uniref:uncharacterized protein LOC105449907 isoform X2 n=1 Tax=Wasmannia auropunctata TaxID=64793 RepID=UPI0005ED49E3|nr:PREDICTED: uncharacterized protein LOC105449907 isoform X2 [Wasmannia auropunctata]
MTIIQKNIILHFPSWSTLIPEWRTSTRYEDISPQYITTPRKTEGYQCPRRRRTRASRKDITTGVAIVPRRIDFDAASDVEDIDIEEDRSEQARETLQRLRSATESPIPTPETVAPGMYRLARTRATQNSPYVRQYVPRMVRITSCGKCLRI